MTDLKYYKAAMCFIESSIDEYSFGNRMASGLYIKQLLLCKGIEFNDNHTSVPDLLDKLKSAGETVLYDTLRDFYVDEYFNGIFDLCHDAIESYTEVDTMDYEPYELLYWDSDFASAVLERNKDELKTDAYDFLLERKHSLIRYMCRYGDAAILDKPGSTYKDVLLQLLEAVHYENRTGYPECFKVWCQQHATTDYKEMYNRLRVRYNLRTPEQLVAFCEANIV